MEVVWGVDSGLAGLGKDGPLPSLGIVGSGRSGPSRVSEATKMSPAQKTEIQETEIGMNTPTLLSHTHLGLKPLGCSLSRQQLAGLPFSHVQHKRPACKVPPGPDAQTSASLMLSTPGPHRCAHLPIVSLRNLHVASL